MEICAPTTCNVRISKEELEILEKAVDVIREMKDTLQDSICDELNYDDVTSFTESELLDLIDSIETLMQVRFATVY